MKKQIDPSVVVKAANREGYEAILKDGRANFPGVVWRVDIGAILERERLAVAWSPSDVMVLSDDFNMIGETLEEAVLKFIAERPDQVK